MKHYICKTKPHCLQVVPSGETVFTIANSQFGYCTLELTRRGKNRHLDIENSLVPLNGKHFLSSRVFRLESEKNVIQSIKELTLAFIKRNVTPGLNPIFRLRTLGRDRLTHIQLILILQISCWILYLH